MSSDYPPQSGQYGYPGSYPPPGAPSPAASACGSPHGSSTV